MSSTCAAAVHVCACQLAPHVLQSDMLADLAVFCSYMVIVYVVGPFFAFCNAVSDMTAPSMQSLSCHIAALCISCMQGRLVC